MGVEEGGEDWLGGNLGRERESTVGEVPGELAVIIPMLKTFFKKREGVCGWVDKKGDKKK